MVFKSIDYSDDEIREMVYHEIRRWGFFEYKGETWDVKRRVDGGSGVGRGVHAERAVVDELGDGGIPLDIWVANARTTRSLGNKHIQEHVQWHVDRGELLCDC